MYQLWVHGVIFGLFIVPTTTKHYNVNADGLSDFYEEQEMPTSAIIIDIVEPPFRAALRGETSRWPNGIVPYVFSKNFDPRRVRAMKRKMCELQANTKSGNRFCVRFRPKRPEDVSYISIDNHSGCSSFIGRQKNSSTKISLDRFCSESVYIHELMHALGFYHEQSRPDRDQFLELHWDNIPYTLRHDLYKRGPNEVTTSNISYDYTSILQYGPFTAFSDFRKPSITAKYQNYLGGRRGALGLPLSEKDVIRIQRYYSCPEDLTNYRKLNKRNIVLDCNFDEDFCNVTQSTDDDFNWSRRRRPTNNRCFPQTDGLPYGKGHCLDTMAKEHLNQQAMIRTPVFDSGDYCFTVALLVHGVSGGGQLEARVVYESGDYKQLRTWSSSLYMWLLYRVNVSERVKWHLLLIATVGNSKEIAIALDDLLIYKKKC